MPSEIRAGSRSVDREKMLFKRGEESRPGSLLPFLAVMAESFQSWSSCHFMNSPVFRIYFKFIFHSAVVNFSFVLQDTILMFQLHFQILLGRAGYTAKSHVFCFLKADSRRMQKRRCCFPPGYSGICGNHRPLSARLSGPPHRRPEFHNRILPLRHWQSLRRNR